MATIGIIFSACRGNPLEHSLSFAMPFIDNNGIRVSNYSVYRRTCQIYDENPFYTPIDL